MEETPRFVHAKGPSLTLHHTEEGMRRLIGEDVLLPVEGRLPSIGGATGWLNSEPLTPASLGPGVGAFAFTFG
jgi:hypothetical protein